MSLAVELRKIVKRFGSVEALSDVDLKVQAGTIHALVGENGAGKTTLMRILYGAIRPTSGEVLLHGNAQKFRSAKEGIAAGIGMVSQHYSILSELTCLQNLLLGAEPGWWMNSKAAEARAEELALRMGFQFTWGNLAETLSPAGAQKLDILKLLWRNAKVLILDEPTAMLTPADSDALYERLQGLAQEGATVIVVTHRLPEVMDYAREVTVLRGGRMVATMPVSDVSSHQLAELIVGHTIEKVQRPAPPMGSPDFLRVVDAQIKGDRGNLAVQELELNLAKGEVVGIAGVDGSGQRELIQALVGVRPFVQGRMILEERDITAMSPQERLKAGLRLIPEDRHEEAVVNDWSLEMNALLGLQRLSPNARGPWLDRKPARELAEQIAERFKTRHPGLNRPMRALSGGNQQRFVAARALQLNPKLILAFAPARGLDIDATRAVYDGLRSACRQGAAALVVSFDLDELLEHCDRVVALCNGRLRVPPFGKERDRATIGRLMVGATP